MQTCGFSFPATCHVHDEDSHKPGVPGRIMSNEIRICEPESDLPAGNGQLQARGYRLATTQGVRDVIVVRRGDELAVFENACPHTGVTLNWLPDQFLDAEGELLQCATHGALFAPDDGRCLRGPCAGQSLRRLSTRLRDGVLYLRV